MFFNKNRGIALDETHTHSIFHFHDKRTLIYQYQRKNHFTCRLFITKKQYLENPCLLY